MACTVTFNLGSDAKVEVNILPTWKCKVLFEVDSGLKYPSITIAMIKKILFIVLRYSKLGLAGQVQKHLYGQAGDRLLMIPDILSL